MASQGSPSQPSRASTFSMLSSSQDRLRARKDRTKEVLFPQKKKSLSDGVIDEGIRSTYSAVSMDERSRVPLQDLVYEDNSF